MNEQALTLGALLDLLQDAVSRRPELRDWKVVLPYSPTEPTLGARASKPVTAVNPGFDWDHGRIFLSYAGEPLCESSAQLKAQAKQLRRLREEVLYFVPKLLSESRPAQERIDRTLARLESVKTMLANKVLAAPALTPPAESGTPAATRKSTDS